MADRGLNLNAPAKEGLGNLVPASPTDNMLSPVSEQLMRQKKGSKKASKSLLAKTLQGQASKSTTCRLDVAPAPEPGIALICGLSSGKQSQVLNALGWSYSRVSPEIDEDEIEADDPYDLPVEIAKAKAQALVESGEMTDGLLITADQVCLYGEEEIRGKPRNEEEARDFLQSYSGASVKTISAVVVTNLESGHQSAGHDVCTVHYGDIPPATIDRVVKAGNTGNSGNSGSDVYDAVGGVLVEDQHLGPCIRHLDGSVDSVFGLPVSLLLDLVEKELEEAGIKTPPPQVAYPKSHFK